MLKKTFAVIAIVSLVGFQTAAQQPLATGQTVLVRKNMVLKFSLLKPLDSATAQVGDIVPLRLSGPLIINGVTLLPEGQVITGKVTWVQRAIRNTQEGKIKWTLDRISFMDSTSAKTRVWFSSTSPGQAVPDSYKRDFPGHEGIEAHELANVVMFFVLLPFSLPALLLERAGMVRGYEDYRLPENSTVAVIVTKDHRVRY